MISEGDLQVITIDAPSTNNGLISYSKINTDKMDETMIAKVVAMTFKIVSAYFTTTAIKSPPNARNKIDSHVQTYVIVESTEYP